LIVLRLDIIENVRGIMVDYQLNLAILSHTDKNYTSEERMEKVFKPVLYPLYEKFLKALYNSGLFGWDRRTLEVPSHTKIDRPYWGTQSATGNNLRNTFSDPLDAIEILNLRVTQNSRKCDRVFDSTFDHTFN
jgi:hypothetical protein